MADYAWSIQTLLALEDIGLTKLPKLAKKTWAEMISESDDDSETDLQKQIQKTKQTKTVCNQKQSHSCPHGLSKKEKSKLERETRKERGRREGGENKRKGRRRRTSRDPNT